MSVEVTKRREQRPAPMVPCWRIYFDGKPTRFFIEKATDVRPAWGSSQRYDLCHDDEGFMCESTVYALMHLAIRMANPFTPGGELP